MGKMYFKPIQIIIRVLLSFGTGTQKCTTLDSGVASPPAVVQSNIIFLKLTGDFESNGNC